MGSPANLTPLHRGDIVLVPFPFTDLTSRKVRPAVIVSPDPQGEDILVAFISSVVPTRPHSTELWLKTGHPEFPATGLKQSSVIKADKLLTLHRSLILRRLGHMGPNSKEELDRRLLQAVGLAK